MPYNTLKLESDGQLSILTFNRPEKRNAISPEMIEELMAALDEIESGPSRVAILTGAGKAFCSGMDLEALRAMAAEVAPGPRPADAAPPLAPLLSEEGSASVKGGAHKERMPRPSATHLADSRQAARLFRRIYDFPRPLIAAVNGAAIAGGCGIATLCDFTLAVPEARFGYTEVRIGFSPAIVSVFLMRQIGEKAARALLQTGRVFDAAEARRLGLVSEIVAPERLMERARELAAELLENSPSSLACSKRLFSAFSSAELDREIELAVQENARIRSTPDFSEGLAAFLEKRKPVWGRE